MGIDIRRIKASNATNPIKDGRTVFVGMCDEGLTSSKAFEGKQLDNGEGIMKVEYLFPR